MRKKRKPLKNQMWYFKKKVLPAVKTFVRILIIIILLVVIYLVPDLINF
jgi:hypothetical protein